ncbi:O-antigen ligase family protein [Clostridium sp.]|uniref:O-antigen ligase family protein n=1 Tax=Clostridium sp. TaxID=1506 RepID=UPI002FCA3F68
MQNYCVNENKVEELYRYLLYASIFSAIIGIIEKILFLIWDMSLWRWLLEATAQPIFENRIYSTFGNPNIAGNWFAIMIILSLYFRDIADKKNRLFYQGTTILFVLTLFLTGSRGAYIGVLFGLAIYWLLKKNKKDVMLFTLIFIFMAALTVIPANLFDFQFNKSSETNGNTITDKIEEGAETHDVGESVNSRVGIWSGSLKMIEDKPITGWGIMAFLEPHSKYLGEYYYKTLFHAHNIWITFTTTLGGVGLCIYLYMKFNLFKNLEILYRRNYRVVPMLAAIQALIIGHGLVDFTIIAPQTGILFIGCSAMITSLVRQQSSLSVKQTLSVSKYKSLSKWS